jgi:IPT/TIG domain
LSGGTSHTHDAALDVTDFVWKEGNQTISTISKTDYDFTAGEHIISLTITDSGGNVDTDVSSVTIRPFGFPDIKSMSPKEGSMGGNYNITISGSSFNFTSRLTTVRFGDMVLNASRFQVINPTTIRVLAPPYPLAIPVPVVVTTPIGSSVPVDFLYVGSAPIQWATAQLNINEDKDNAIKFTVVRFGPDKKLYAGGYYGTITKITMNANFTAVVDHFTVAAVPPYTM